jgi:hypothetical protein
MEAPRIDPQRLVDMIALQMYLEGKANEPKDEDVPPGADQPLD